MDLGRTGVVSQILILILLFFKTLHYQTYSVHFAKCDVSSKDDWKRAWDEAEDVLSGKIEILCNNAGVPPRVCCFL